MKPLTQKEFNKITQNYERTVLFNNGLYRHIKYSLPDSINMSWHVITYPGGATITGDYGRTYTFEREKDMLKDFFNTQYANMSYWEEKVVSGRRTSTREYNPNLVKQYLKETLKNHGYSKRNIRRIVNEIQLELSICAESESAAMSTLANLTVWVELVCAKGHYRWECECEEPAPEGKIVWTDLDPDYWEADFTSYRRDFRFACYALKKTANELYKTQPKNRTINMTGNNATHIENIINIRILHPTTDCE